ncbi:hypothetical protein F442_19427 [Phytophthora nicotianae P10297]|uniref:Uncharacterized protein n=1 Tax=Phytophthora nicotianae P10297 TaxID=1317064 RepID=W2YAU6_PHYNI|nr:hypothetical protein F442_19427 [Phytophthora nicotianae P10297]
MSMRKKTVISTNHRAFLKRRTIYAGARNAELCTDQLSSLLSVADHKFLQYLNHEQGFAAGHRADKRHGRVRAGRNARPGRQGACALLRGRLVSGLPRFPAGAQQVLRDCKRQPGRGLRGLRRLSQGSTSTFHGQAGSLVDGTFRGRDAHAAQAQVWRLRRRRGERAKPHHAQGWYPDARGHPPRWRGRRLPRCR